MTRHIAFTGQPYQLTSKSELPIGAYVQINGPWDTFGQITSREKKPDGSWLNRIRGIQQKRGQKPVYQF